MRNALLPVVTVIGLEFAFLIGGLVVTEQVFNLNGIGKLFVEAVTRADYTMVQSLVMLIAAFFIVINIIVDLIYARSTRASGYMMTALPIGTPADGWLVRNLRIRGTSSRLSRSAPPASSSSS
jgi:hypothetical protein